MVVPAGLNLDVPAPDDGQERGHVHLQGAGADGEDVHQAVPGPRLEVEAVLLGPFDALGDSHGQQEGAPALLRGVLEHEPDPAEKCG